MAKKKVVEEQPKTITAKVINGNLNVRSGKSTDHDIVRVLKDGEEVTVLKDGKMWCQIGENEYVMRQYLSF